MEKTICIFGASITAGAFDVEQGGWVARLKNYFWQNDYDAMIYNMGVSGDNTEDLLERFKPESNAREPNLIIFSIGTNDSQYIGSKDKPRVDLEKFENNLKKLVAQAQSLAPDIVFVGLTNVDEARTMLTPWSENKYYDNDNVARYDSVIKSLCEENKFLFISIRDLLTDDDIYDGLHPNSEGHRKMFERIKDALVKDKLVE